MLIQNVSKRSYVLNIGGEEKEVVSNQTIDIEDEIAKDLLSNYPSSEWKALEIVSYKEEKKDDSEEVSLPKETKVLKSKNKKK